MKTIASRFFCLALALSLPGAALPAAAQTTTKPLGPVSSASPADELIDSGWVTRTPAQLGEPVESDRMMFHGVTVTERGAVQSDALAVVHMEMEVENKVDYDLYFDIDVVARDAEGQILFTMTLGPNVLGLFPRHKATLSQTRYVVPGSLARVASYDFRYLGFR